MPAVSWRLKLIAVAMTTVTLASPAYGLLAVILLTPFGPLLEAATRQRPFRISEALVLTFVAAWLLRAHVDRRGPRMSRTMAAAGWLLGVAAVTSVAACAWRLADYPNELTQTTRYLVQGYYSIVDRIGFIEATRLIEGFALVAATFFLLRRQPVLANHVPTAICAAGAIAGAASILVWRGIGPASVLDHYSRMGYRAAHIEDPNAAGSYFAMTMCLAAGMTVRAKGRARWAWMVVTVLNAIGVWFSESRSAMAAAFIVMALASAWALTSRWTARARLAALAALLILGIAGTSIRARLLERDPTFRGGGFRQQFNATSFRMITARPLTGIGIGQYYSSSPLFLSPQIAWTYGVENAHNYYLQLAAELGVPGFALFVVWIGAAMVVIARALALEADARLLGAAAGVIAFLGTCITGHPLLVGEVAFPFWIQFAIALGLARSALMNAAPAGELAPPRRRLEWLAPAIAGGVIVAFGLSGAARGPIEPPQTRAVNGLYEWERAEDGRPFRWTEEYASLFVPTHVRKVFIPVRVPTDRRAVVPIGVEIAVAGAYQFRALANASWSVLTVPLPEALPSTRYKRIDLKMDRTWQPALYIAGNGDMRHVGVQVGECEWERE